MDMDQRVSELLLGVDIGTSSTKGVLVTPGGVVVAMASRQHGISLPRPGWAEHDAEGVWWGDFVAVCRELMPQAAGGIAAVCVSGIGPCLLACNKAGMPLRPAILYGIDTRASAEIEELNQRFGAENVLSRCGSALTSQSVGPKLLWLQRNEPGVWSKTRRLLMASSFVVHRLTGEYVLDHPSASQCQPLYDLAGGAWSGDWSEVVAPGLDLPRLLWPAEVAGVVTSAGAAATGIPRGTPVAAGTIDAWAEARSVDVSVPGDLMIMYGTTMFVVEVAGSVEPSPSLWLTAGVQPHTRTFAAGMATSGAVTAWFRKLVGNPDFETLFAEAGLAAPGSNGLIALPYFAGERTPIFDPDARGLLIGLTLRHTRGHVYRALLEGTAFGVRHILDSLSAAGGGGKRIVAVGGGARARLWTRIVTDVTGRLQELPRVTIGASYGDAALAGIAVRLLDHSQQWNEPGETLSPDRTTRDVYEEQYALFRSLYAATAPQMHALARIQAES